MGVKLSKFFKRSYVISEGVQTDLSIQSCNEAFDSSLFITPPRDVVHLCDPRSISRGIVRTPIICKVHEGCIENDLSCDKKPYLETNLDELPPYDCHEGGDYVIDIVSPVSHGSAKVIENNSLLSEKHCSDITDELQKTQTCKIEIIENIEVKEITYESTCSKTESVELKDSINYRCGLLSDPEVEIDSNPLQINIVNDNLLNCPVQINSSETVELVCQKILDEYLLSDNQLGVDKSDESSPEVFVDENISDIVESMRKLCIGTSGSAGTSAKKLISDVGYLTPVTSKFQSKYNNALNNLGEPMYNSPKQITQRKPLGEVNKNIQLNRPQLGSTKLNEDIENSPLKAMLPLLPVQAVVPPSKSHRSKWDTENTLII